MDKLDEKGGDTFFLERIGDGFVFACSEIDAWNTLKNASNWQRKDFKLVGTSDGKTYKKVLAKSKAKREELNVKLQEIRTKLERYVAAEEKMLYTDLLEETDPKVLRARQLRDDATAELVLLEDELQNLSQTIVTEAFNAELEAAKLTPRMPENMDVEAPGAKREEVLRAMGKQK